MQIVIDIPKSLYANLQKIQNGSIAAKRILECVRNGKRADVPDTNVGEYINREDALMCLTGEWTELTDEVIHRFIKRIKNLPLMVLPKHIECEDCVSRQAAIDLADELKDDLPDDDHLSDMVMSHNEGILEYQTKLSLLPPVTPAGKVGHWMMSDDGLYRPICNNCGAHPWKGYIPTVEEATEVFKYCPQCGSRMMQEVEKEC